MSYGLTGYKYHLDFGRWKFEDYVVRYMNSEFSCEIYQGLRFIDEQKYSEAVVALNQAIKNNPESAEAFDGLGKAHEKLGNQDAAICIA